MLFEYDSNKSQINAKKHGINFDEAKELFNDPDLLEFTAQTEDEKRCLIIGKIGTRHWTAIITVRGQAIRIISVRRARKKEIAYYESI